MPGISLPILINGAFKHYGLDCVGNKRNALI